QEIDTVLLPFRHGDDGVDQADRRDLLAQIVGEGLRLLVVVAEVDPRLDLVAGDPHDRPAAVAPRDQAGHQTEQDAALEIRYDVGRYGIGQQLGRRGPPPVEIAGKIPFGEIIQIDSEFFAQTPETLDREWRRIENQHAYLVVGQSVEKVLEYV